MRDVKTEAGQEVFHRLVKSANAVYANLRGDVVRGLGLTYEALGPINPAIVCCTLSAYGRDGDRSTEPGYDPLTQAEAGWAALTGDPGGPPVQSGWPGADRPAGPMAARVIAGRVRGARQAQVDGMAAEAAARRGMSERG